MFPKSIFSLNGGACPSGHAQAQSACPHSLEKTFYWKELLCTVCVCKKWEWRFLKHLAVLTLWICACLSIFSLQKDWIRIFWTFIDSKKVNPCFFLLARSSAKIKSLLFEIFKLAKWNSCFLSFFNFAKNWINVFKAFLNSYFWTSSTKS